MESFQVDGGLFHVSSFGRVSVYGKYVSFFRFEFNSALECPVAQLPDFFLDKLKSSVHVMM